MTPLRGGEGAGRDAINSILAAQGSLARVIEEYLNLDSEESHKVDIGSGNF